MNVNETSPAPAPQSVGTRNLRVELGARSYDIRIAPGLLANVGPLCVPLLKSRQILIVTDRTVGPLFGRALASSFQKAGFDGSAVELPPGEGAKSLEVAKFLYDRCFDAHLERSSALVALGGGVLGDLSGFVAATFMRGIDFVQVPTTLLAMVDASVGGKVAVDHPKAKNAIGAFHQPRAVFIDPQLLDKLPDRELRSGLAEIIKYGVMDHVSFFEFIESNIDKILRRDPGALTQAIDMSCQIKARIVGDDEREREGGPRALLNYGHTFAHAIETSMNYQGYSHGEAVAIGMVLAGELSVARKLLARADADRIRALIAKAGLPTALKPGDPDPEVLHQASFRDKKVVAGKLRFILATAIGASMSCDDVTAEEARKTWAAPRD